MAVHLEMEWNDRMSGSPLRTQFRLCELGKIGGIVCRNQGIFWNNSAKPEALWMNGLKKTAAERLAKKEAKKPTTASKKRIAVVIYLFVLCSFVPLSFCYFL